jgi:hypothetical protein
MPFQSSPRPLPSKRYQVVDEGMEDRQIVGKLYFESDHDERVLEKLPVLRKEHPDISLVMIDTWRNRARIA